jgi:hypothetical protein
MVHDLQVWTITSGMNVGSAQFPDRDRRSIVLDNADRLTSCLELATEERSLARPSSYFGFSDCPNHPAARAMLESVIAEVAPGTSVCDIDATDPVTATDRLATARNVGPSSARCLLIRTTAIAR